MRLFSIDIGLLVEGLAAMQDQLMAVIRMWWARADWEIEGANLGVRGVSVSEVLRVKGSYLRQKGRLAHG
jgi:hypothetical protein